LFHSLSQHKQLLILKVVKKLFGPKTFKKQVGNSGNYVTSSLVIYLSSLIILGTCSLEDNKGIFV